MEPTFGSSRTSTGCEIHSSGCLTSLSSSITVRQCQVFTLIWPLFFWVRFAAILFKKDAVKTATNKPHKACICQLAVWLYLFCCCYQVPTWDYGLTLPLDGHLWVLHPFNPVFKAVGKVFISSCVCSAVECCWWCSWLCIVFPLECLLECL